MSDATPLVHPLLFDALSGEFRPFRDRPEETHTLGRLSVASFIKGEVSNRYTIRGGSVVEVTYSPSWAPEVTATSSAVVGRSEIDGSTATLFGMRLEHKAGPELTVVEQDSVSILDEEKVLNVAGSEIPSSMLSLTLANADESRMLVAEAAQTFFDRANEQMAEGSMLLSTAVVD